MFQIKLEKQSQKNLEKIPEVAKLKILAALSILSHNPFLGKKLQGKLSGSFVYRVWPHRIVYKIYKDMLLVVVTDVGHRKDVYK